jgi:hypothetical protein
MKINASELQGAALNNAVHELAYPDEPIKEGCTAPPYSTDWAFSGPIIEREWLDITPWPNESDEKLRWQCEQHDNIDCVAFGPTPLIAAMRCLVASKLGDKRVSLLNFVVLYRTVEMMPIEAPLCFQCWGDDSDHAEEQCRNAYPGCDVVWVWEGPEIVGMMPAFDDYWNDLQVQMDDKADKTVHNFRRKNSAQNGEKKQ